MNRIDNFLDFNGYIMKIFFMLFLDSYPAEVNKLL